MQSQARVVVVGGGIGGLSALYHLTEEGWTDVVLLERNELTSGTTWHSAAQCPSLAFNQLLLLLRDYTIKLYKELADDPAYPSSILSKPDCKDSSTSVTNSEIDVLVAFDGPATSERYSGVRFNLEDLFGHPVGPVTDKALRAEPLIRATPTASPTRVPRAPLHEFRTSPW